MKTIKIIFLLIGLISTSQLAHAAKGNTLVVKTSGVCAMCKTAIETALLKTEGVQSAYFNLANGIVRIKYDKAKTNPDALRLVISKIGYDADNVPADKAAYDALHTCCKKGNECKH